MDTLDMTECDEDTIANGCFIKDAASDTYTPVADDVGDTLVAVALYTDGSPNAIDTPKDFAMAVTAQQVLADTRNKAPFFPDLDPDMEGDQTDAERSIEENTVAGVDIGAPVIAMDFITDNAGMQTDETLTYSLGGIDAASFGIVRTSGLLQTKAELDYETKQTYTVEVTATDPSQETATVTVTIKVTDDDEEPEIMVGGLAISGMARVDYAENGMGDVATYTASGPDAAMATWSLSGDDAGDFNFIDGALTFRSSPNYEAAADADTDNVYMVTVGADDGTYMDSHDVTVTVTNVDEMGTVTLSTTRPIVDTAITANLDDPDGDVTDVTWQWASENSDGTYSDISGATDASYTPVADDATKHLRVTVMYNDAHGSQELEERTENVVTAGDPLVVRYDANNNGKIEKPELIDAINDYLFGDEVLTKDEVIGLINAHLFPSGG